MEYGYSVLMAVFSAALLFYAGLMALFKDDKLLPLRARLSVDQNDKERYMLRIAKMLALAAASPALSALAGLWSFTAAMIVLVVSMIFFLWLGAKITK